MEIYQLRTFVSVAREGTVKRASELLFLSQPAVSAHIKAMEAELGVLLFERTQKGMALTPDGVRLLAKAEQTLKAHRELVDEAKLLRGRVSGKVTVGNIGNPSAVILGKLLTGVSEAYPEIEITLRQASSGELLRDLQDGALDVCFANSSSGLDPSIFGSVVIDRTDVYVAIPAAWTERIEAGDWHTLSSLPWLWSEPATFCGSVTERLFAEHDIQPPRVYCANDENVRHALIAGGVGIGLLHGDSARRAQELGEVVLWQDMPQDEAQLTFLFLAKREADPVIAALAEIVRKSVESSRRDDPDVPG